MSLIVFIVLANALLLYTLSRKLRNARGLFFGVGCGLVLVSLALYGILGEGWLAERAAEKQSRLFTEQAASFAALSASEREARIHAMVEALSDRLHSEGGPPESWLRLARARSVLGEKPATRSVLRQAERAHPAAATDPTWIAVSISLLLAPPFAAEDKSQVLKLLERWRQVSPGEDSVRDDLERRLAPLLQ